MSDNTDATDTGGDEGKATSGRKSERTFDPITSQEDFEARLKDRLDRERSKFADYDDLQAKAEKFDEIEAANKSELEKAEERAANAEARAAELEAARQVAAWKDEISEATGVPVKALAGTTREDIEAHAETLQSLLDSTTPPPPHPLVIPAVGKTPPALNSSKLEESLRRAVGAS